MVWADFRIGMRVASAYILTSAWPKWDIWSRGISITLDLFAMHQDVAEEMD